MSLSDLKKLFRKYIKVLPGGPATDDITRGVGVLAVLDALAEEVKNVPAGTPLPIAAALAAVQQDLSDGLDLTAGARYDITGNWNAAGTPATVFVQALRVDAFSPSGILLTGGVYSRVKVNVPAGTAVADAGAAVVLYDSPGPGTDGAMTQKAVTDALATKGSQATQDQHSEQLATLGVQGSPVYGYLDGTDEPVGYPTLDEALADPRQKTFFRFNKSTIRLSASNNPTSPGWAYAVDGEGATIELGADVRLNVPGLNRDALTLEKFFVYQQPGTRGGRVKLLATNRDGVADGDLPFWQGGCNVPVELSGGAFGLQGTFTSFIGIGTIHLYEPYSYGYVSPGITLVEHKAGAGGAGTVKSVFGVSPDAAGDVSPAVLDIYNVPQSVRDAVVGGTFGGGELQGATPDGSLAGHRFTSATYGYEYQRGAAGNLVWCRYPKG